ncbi:MAG: methyltransferase domain-containing protein [Burkholderiales bacterium]|nr:methyltransferase domain-containing protein [Burkholderiales bacterium]
MPWDAGGVPEALRRYACELPPGARILVPGCGSAYELYHLLENGFDALAIDFSPPAVARAQASMGRFADRVIEADFFVFEQGAPFDVMYERAFLCALPRKTWAAYARRTAQLLAPGGAIAGFFFFDDNPKGPPFGTSEQELHALLDPLFEREQDEPVSDSIPVFKGKERWQVWRRRE